MKKLFVALLIVVALAFSSFTYAAETMVISGRGYHTSEGSSILVLQLLCTTDTDGSFSYQLSSDMFNYMNGWLIIDVRVINSTAQTDPTANSDLTFPIAAAGTFDLLGGAGADMVDNDAINSVTPLNAGGNDFPIAVRDQFFVEVANNIVDTAIFTIEITCVPSA